MIETQLCVCFPATTSCLIKSVTQTNSKELKLVLGTDADGLTTLGPGGGELGEVTMSHNVYEEPRFSLTERPKADGGEREERSVEIYESADAADGCQDSAVTRKGGTVELKGGRSTLRLSEDKNQTHLTVVVFVT